jgi:hypothetical protein
MELIRMPFSGSDYHDLHKNANMKREIRRKTLQEATGGFYTKVKYAVKLLQLSNRIQ